MNGEPKKEDSPVEQAGVETPHVNPYIGREEQEKANEYKLVLEKWQADLDVEVEKMRLAGDDEQTIELFIEYSPKPVQKIENSHEKEKKELEKKLADFEKLYPLDYLYSIKNLTPKLVKLFGFKKSIKKEREEMKYLAESLSPEDLIKFEERAAAKDALIPIINLMKVVYGKEYYLQHSYQRLSNAIGIYNEYSNKIDRDMDGNVGRYF